ncbi:MAG: FG-GAP repeat protein, partial [Candidatus Latescibacteria bacterium]|nr:FG-GAP repeat protein [Candidatus Latescibacterota bacterium]
MMRHVKTFFGGLRIGNLNPLMAGVVGFALALTGIACLVLGAEVKLTASDAATGDRFGYSVSIDGQYAIIGAKEDDDVEETGPGAAYIYHSIENLSLPVELATLTAQAGDAQLTLTWSPNTEPDLSHYIIYRSQTHDFTPTLIDSVGSVDQPNSTFTDAD